MFLCTIFVLWSIIRPSIHSWKHTFNLQSVCKLITACPTVLNLSLCIQEQKDHTCYKQRLLIYTPYDWFVNVLLELRLSWNLFCLYSSLSHAFSYTSLKVFMTCFFTKHFNHTSYLMCMTHSSEMTLQACTEHQWHRIDFQVTCWLLGYLQLLFLICHLCVYGCLLVCYCCIIATKEDWSKCLVKKKVSWKLSG